MLRARGATGVGKREFELQAKLPSIPNTLHSWCLVPGPIKVASIAFLALGVLGSKKKQKPQI